MTTPQEPRLVPVADLTQAQLWEAEIWVTEDAYIDVFTGREMEPGELVRVADELEMEAGPVADELELETEL
jgi:hypothetical protein